MDLSKSFGSRGPVGFAFFPALCFATSPRAGVAPEVSTLDQRISHSLLRQHLHWLPPANSQRHEPRKVTLSFLGAEFHCPHLADSGPTFIRFSPLCLAHGQSWSAFDRTRPNLGQIRPGFENTSGNLDRSWPGSGRHRLASREFARSSSWNAHGAM